MEGDLVVAVDRHLVEIAVPGFARIDPELLARLPGEQVPSALDVASGERFAVMPFDALAQCKGQPRPLLVPRPTRGEIGNDRLEAVLLHMLIEHDEVVEHPHHRPEGGNRRFLVDRHAGGAVEMRHSENAARLLRLGRLRSSGRGNQQHRGRCKAAKLPPHLIPSLVAIEPFDQNQLRHDPRQHHTKGSKAAAALCLPCS